MKADNPGKTDQAHPGAWICRDAGTAPRQLGIGWTLGDTTGTGGPGQNPWAAGSGVPSYLVCPPLPPILQWWPKPTLIGQLTCKASSSFVSGSLKSATEIDLYLMEQREMCIPWGVLIPAHLCVVSSQSPGQRLPSYPCRHSLQAASQIGYLGLSLLWHTWLH